MKKEEASILAKEKAHLLMNYIMQILTDEEKVHGEILIHSAKIDNLQVCTFDIKVSENNFERHLNTGITTNHCDILNEEILQSLTNTFLGPEDMVVSRYYNIRGGYGMNMNGVRAINDRGSEVKINFLCIGENFNKQIDEYNARINKFVEEQTSSKSR